MLAALRLALRRDVHRHTANHELVAVVAIRRAHFSPDQPAVARAHPIAMDRRRFASDLFECRGVGADDHFAPELRIAIPVVDAVSEEVLDLRTDVRYAPDAIFFD